MTGWQILALVLGVLWTIVGTGFATLALVFKGGVYGGGGAGWGGVAFAVALALPGLILIVWAVS